MIFVIFTSLGSKAIFSPFESVANVLTGDSFASCFNVPYGAENLFKASISIDVISYESSRVEPVE